MFPAMEDLPQILTTEAGWTPKYEKIVHIDNMEHVSHKRTLHQTFDPCLPCITPFTKHTMKQSPFTTRNYYTPIMKLATTMSSVSCGRLRIAFTCCRHRYSYLSTMISQLVPKGCRGPGQIPVFSIRRAPAGQRPAERPRRLSAGASSLPAVFCWCQASLSATV